MTILPKILFTPSDHFPLLRDMYRNVMLLNPETLGKKARNETRCFIENISTLPTAKKGITEKFANLITGTFVKKMPKTLKFHCFACLSF